MCNQAGLEPTTSCPILVDAVRAWKNWPRGHDLNVRRLLHPGDFRGHCNKPDSTTSRKNGSGSRLRSYKGFPGGFLPHRFHIVVWTLSSSLTGGWCKVSTHGQIDLARRSHTFEFRVHRLSQHFNKNYFLRCPFEQSTASTSSAIPE